MGPVIQRATRSLKMAVTAKATATQINGRGDAEHRRGRVVRIGQGGARPVLTVEGQAHIPPGGIIGADELGQVESNRIRLWWSVM